MDDKDFLRLALEQARESVNQGGFPAGAVIVKNGKVISEGLSLARLLHDPTSHAETTAIREACKILGTNHLDGATLYESLACCNMCFSVANWAGLSRIVTGTQKTQEMVEKDYYEGATDSEDLNKSNNHKIELVFIPDFEQESLDLIKEWESKMS